MMMEQWEIDREGEAARLVWLLEHRNVRAALQKALRPIITEAVREVIQDLPTDAMGHPLVLRT